MGIDVRPLTPALGAEVSGLDLRAPLPASDRDALRSALHRHLALFVRHAPLSPEAFVSFGRGLGELEVHPFAPQTPEHPELVTLDQVHPVGEGADAWHADATFTEAPPAIGILQAVTLPKLGGDTCFASAAAAYDALSPAVRGLLDGLRGVHDLTAQLEAAIRNGTVSFDVAEMQRRWPPRSHPVVLQHPETGRRGLFVNSNYTTRIEGLTPAESARTLTFLFEHLRTPDFQFRFRWEPGSIAIWDNRFVQHYAVPDYRERRVMQRLNVAGPPPAGGGSP